MIRSKVSTHWDNFKLNIMEKSSTKDWRYDLFGPTIIVNTHDGGEDDEEVLDLAKPNLISPPEAFDTTKYDYIAVFIGANYNPYSKEFASDVIKSSTALEEKRRCKVIFVSGDRDNKGFEKSVKKVNGLDVMPYDIERARKIRDLFDIEALPALVILRNENFDATEPPVVTVNARNLLKRDPELEKVQWNKKKNSNKKIDSELDKVQWNDEEKRYKKADSSTISAFEQLNVVKKSSTKDWRYDLFGSTIIVNTNDGEDDEEVAKPNLISPPEAFDTTKYDYIAVFIGADYCPFCKEFAPDVIKSSTALEEKRRCKVIFVSGDRDNDGFEKSVKKVNGLDVMSYDLARARKIRDLFDIETIPALVILRNENFDATEPVVIVNARNLLKRDPELEKVQWNKKENRNKKTIEWTRDSITLHERFFKGNGLGKWSDLGFSGLNPEDPDKMYMDEHAVRIRAGILNMLSWGAIMNIFGPRNPMVLYTVLPIASFELFTTTFLGLGPLGPLAIVGNLLTHVLQPKAHWKPAKPKQFAWAIGDFLVVLCLCVYVSRFKINEAANGFDLTGVFIAIIAFICNSFTWLESSAGFCVGCWIYNRYLVKWFGLEECAECKM